MGQGGLGGVLQGAAANRGPTRDVHLFEIGAVYLPQPGQKLPGEPRRLAMVLTGRRQPEFWGEPDRGQASELDFFDLKGVVEALVADLHLPESSYRPATVSHLHPGKAAEF